MGSWCASKTTNAVINWLKYYILFSKPIIFISVLIFSNSFVDNGVVALLITYLIDNWEVSLLGAAIFVTAQQGLSSVLVIIISHIADAYLGLFNVIFISSILLIVALVLLWQLQNIALFTVVMILLALGAEGREGPLRQFLTDQFRDREPSDVPVHEQEKRAEARSTTWWQIWRFVGSAASTLALGQVIGGIQAFIAAIVMAVALLIFLSGFTFYYRQPTQPTPLTMLLTVVKAAISKRRLPYPSRPNSYYKNDTKQIMILPKVWFSRWVDKAAIILERSALSPQQQEEAKKLCKVGEVREVKLFLRMVPMWATFVVYSFIDVTGSTLFYEQASNLDNSLANNIIVPLSLFQLIKRCVSYGISYACDSVIQERWSKMSQLLATKIRIAMGMGCGVLACFAAWVLEVQRLRKLNKLQNPGGEIDMSIFLLTPQFFLLGLMEGLAVEGLHEFLDLQVGRIMATYGELFNELAFGLGKLVCIFWLLAFRVWFADSINNSHLDRYYLVLVFLGIVNLLFAYGSVCIFAYKDAMGDVVSSSDENPDNDDVSIQLEENSDNNLVKLSKNDDLSIQLEENPGNNLVGSSKDETEGIQVEENPDSNIVRSRKNDTEGIQLEENPDNNLVGSSKNETEGIQVEENPDDNIVRSRKNDTEGIQLEENPDNNLVGSSKNETEGIQMGENHDNNIVRSRKRGTEGIQLEDPDSNLARSSGDDTANIQVQETISQARRDCSN